MPKNRTRICIEAEVAARIPALDVSRARVWAEVRANPLGMFLAPGYRYEDEKLPHPNIAKNALLGCGTRQ